MNVWVRVIGFSSEERHAIQTLLHLSESGDVRFRLWQPGYLLSPNVVIIDADSHEAELQVHSPGFNPQTKALVVGHGLNLASAWRVLERPLDWAKVLHELEALFVCDLPDLTLHDPDEAFASTQAMIPPGYKTALVIGLAREDQLYLKARLSLQGIAHVSEVANAAQAAEALAVRGYDIVIISASLPDADVCPLVQVLQEQAQAPQTIIVVVERTDWHTARQLESLGIAGVLERPFEPHLVAELFGRV